MKCLSRLSKVAERVGDRPLAGLFALTAAVVCLPAAVPAMTSELAGTSWRLVNITSMDDSVYVPEKPSAYTLEFRPDGFGGDPL